MTDFFARRGAGLVNELRQSLGALLGIATGLLADRQLNDAEIRFLKDWLDVNDAAAVAWPGDVLHARVKAVLADGKISESERTHLVETLQQIIGGGGRVEPPKTRAVATLMFDSERIAIFRGTKFCLTGNFVFAPKETCCLEIQSRGGIVVESVTKALRYLVVGGLGSPEWKHGSFGTKVEKAMRYKREGVEIGIIHEDDWLKSLKSFRA